MKTLKKTQSPRRSLDIHSSRTVARPAYVRVLDSTCSLGVCLALPLPPVSSGNSRAKTPGPVAGWRCGSRTMRGNRGGGGLVRPCDACRGRAKRGFSGTNTGRPVQRLPKTWPVLKGPPLQASRGVACEATERTLRGKPNECPIGNAPRTEEGGREACPLPARCNADASYLVDPASSHMLVSKIKPCMCKYERVHGETANGSLNQLWFLRSLPNTWITVVILELIHAAKPRSPQRRAQLLDQDQRRTAPRGTGYLVVTLDNLGRIARPPRRRRIFQMSALSNVEGTCYASLVCNG